jgi:hypothetical protein
VGAVTAAVKLPTTAGEVAALAELRTARRVVEVAANLLASLDYTRAGARLPAGARVQVSRLRHAVKLAIHPTTTTATLPAVAPAPASAAGEVARAVGRWAATQPWAQLDPGPLGWVYLLCFRDPHSGEHQPYRGRGAGGQYAGHYIGWTDDLVRRVTREHANPNWTGRGRLVRVALAAGLRFELAWVEYPATRGRERRIKNQGSAYRRCPLCRGTGAPLDPTAVMAMQAGGPDADPGGRARRAIPPDPDQLAPRRELP